MMELLKTPHQKILEEAGASPLPSPGILNTPKQMLFQEAGILPKYAEGNQVKSIEQQLSPEQMMAALIINGYEPPKFKYADGGSVETSILLKILSHPDFYKHLEQYYSQSLGNQ